MMLLLHGFMGCGEDWLTFIESFRVQYRIIVPDLPGHGQSMSDNPSTYDFHNVVAELHDIVQSMEAGKTVLIGYSMGGRLALSLALKYPGLWERVVIESASPGPGSEADKNERKKQDRQ